ncbi:MAG TPA: Do family serine endopeptidase [Pirellulales bacterium]|jgi:serine protease Do|nr:Do family serine endopeptidase [Pirellulales bacterium]
MSRPIAGSRTLFLLALIGLLAVGASRWQTGAVGQEKAATIKPGQVHQAEQLSAAFRHAAEVAMPSVVTVHSKSKAHVTKHTKVNPHSKRNGENPFKGTPFEGIPFEDFFGNMPDGGQSHPRHEGVGSGVIVDSSGIILTNNHVVDGADEVIVELADGREFKAEEVKTDPSSDLAVVRIKGAGSLPAAQLGNSDDMQIGDWVLAIGNPFNLDQTVSAGIISGKGRKLDGTRVRMLQTDAAINPGNSGGPLVNLEGEVIGINTAIATNNGAFQGVGFVIPSNLTKWVMGQLIKKGTVERAYLGVALDPEELTSEKAAMFHAKQGEGVIVSEVLPDSPAAEAGLQSGDIITEFNGTKVHNRPELQELVERAAVGTHQKLSVFRDGKSITVDVTPKAMPTDHVVRNGHPATDEAEDAAEEYSNSSLGIEVGELSTQTAKALEMKKAEGVVISKVDPDSVAAEKGLSEGMVILAVGKQSVKSVAEFRAAMKDESLDKGVLLLIRTRGGNRFMVLQQAAE